MKRAHRGITLIFRFLLVFVAVSHLALTMLFLLHCRPLGARGNPKVHASCLSTPRTVLAGYVGLAVDVCMTKIIAKKSRPWICLFHYASRRLLIDRSRLTEAAAAEGRCPVVSIPKHGRLARTCTVLRARIGLGYLYSSWLPSLTAQRRTKRRNRDTDYLNEMLNSSPSRRSSETKHNHPPCYPSM